MATPDTTPPPVRAAPSLCHFPRVAVVGDIGGHADRLDEALIGLGADPESATLPDGLTVVQVGDLLQARQLCHREPGCAERTAAAARGCARSPDGAGRRRREQIR